MQSDLNDPTGSINYANGPYASHSVHITTSASDGESGVGSTQVERSEAPLTGATCGAWSSFAPITLNGGGNDTTVLDNTCYRYQLVVTDNVGNTYTAASANVAQIPDITPPTFVTAATNVAGTQLTVTMSEPLDATATTPASAFTVSYNGVVQPTPTGISVSGSTVTLDLASPPNNSEIVTIRYSQPSSAGDRMRDNAVPTPNETRELRSGRCREQHAGRDRAQHHLGLGQRVDDHPRVRRGARRSRSRPECLHGHHRRDDSHGQRGHDERQGRSRSRSLLPSRATTTSSSRMPCRR